MNTSSIILPMLSVGFNHLCYRKSHKNVYDAKQLGRQTSQQGIKKKSFKWCFSPS